MQLLPSDKTFKLYLQKLVDGAFRNCSSQTKLDYLIWKMFHCPINAIRTYMWIQLDPVLGATLVTGNMAPKSGLAAILKVEIFSVLKMW